MSICFPNWPFGAPFERELPFSSLSLRMLASKFSQSAVSWLGASVKAPKAKVARKVSLKSSILKKSNKISVPAFTKMSVRFVTTIDEGITVNDEGIKHLTDLRGHEHSAEFLTGVPQSQLHRRVTIYRPTPKTTQSGTKVRDLYTLNA